VLEQLQQQKDKRERKKTRTRAEKYKTKLALKMINPEDFFDTQEQDLFSVGKAPTINSQDIDAMHIDVAEASDDVYLSSDEELEDAEDNYKSIFDPDKARNSDDEGTYETLIENYLDNMYDHYLEANKTKKKRDKIGKKEKPNNTIDVSTMIPRADPPSFIPDVSSNAFADIDEENLNDENSDNDGEQISKRTAMWFSDPQFKDVESEYLPVDEDEEIEDAEADEDMRLHGINKRKRDETSQENTPLPKKKN